MISITLQFNTVQAALQALMKLELPPETISTATEAPKAPKADKPAKAPAAAPVPAATPPSAVTAPTAAPFEYATLRNKVLPLLPKHGVDPFNGIAGEFGFPNLKTLGEKGTPTQWAEAFAKVEAFEAAQAAA